MIKIFVTGDNHFGMKYMNYPEVSEMLIQSRYDSLGNMVVKANEENCNIFAVTGDMFDTPNISKNAVQKAVDILSRFNGTVFILPGNHDHYSGIENVWKYYDDAAKNYQNMVLLNEYREYPFDENGEEIVIYPAFCDKKHSSDNKLGWIREADIDKSKINIGIAHGSVEGYSPDLKNEYFVMTEKELRDIPVDVWLLGHTHISFPNDLKEDKDTEGHTIFNPGTHEQTDLSNNTEGLGFIITVEKENGKAKILARKYVSGQIRYYDLTVSVTPDSDDSLENALDKEFKSIGANSVIRINVKGSIKREEYERRTAILEKYRERFLSYKWSDRELSEEVSDKMIYDEFGNDSFASKFLVKITDPVERYMAYILIHDPKVKE